MPRLPRERCMDIKQKENSGTGQSVSKNLTGKCVAICHLGEIGWAISNLFRLNGADVRVFESPADFYVFDEFRPDIAICTSGKMHIGHPAPMSSELVSRMFELNYLIPRQFTEASLAAGAKLVIHIGSNSARYGKSYAEDYAAAKAALWKYCEIRGALAAKENGARITCLNLGGVNNGFWEHVRQAPAFNSAAAANLIPADGKGLTNAEVAELVMAICLLPENVAIKDLLVTAKAYQ